MRFKFSLRYRVALAFLMLGWFISVAMGGTLYWLTIDMEKGLIEETLKTELEDYISHYLTNSTTQPPFSAHIKGYVVTKEIQNAAPAELQTLPIGLSHIVLDSAGYFVESKSVNTTRFYVLYADVMIKQRESQYLTFLLLGISLMTLLSSALGFWLAGRVILPVTRLARDVSAMKPGFGVLPVPIDLPLDEVGELMRAINHYQQRLTEFNERERSFTGNVSHELRTPLAIIAGASEVMLTESELSQSSRKKVERIMRANTQMTRLITALLALAREESGRDNKQRCSVNDVLNQVAGDHQYLLNHKPVEAKLSLQSDLVIFVDPDLLYITLANIIRNAYSYTSQGTVNIHSHGKGVVIEDTGAGLKKDQLLKIFDRDYSGSHSSSGHGIGLSLVDTICKRYGWEISVRSLRAAGTTVELILSSSFSDST